MTGNFLAGIVIGVVEEVAVGKKEEEMNLPHHAMIGGRNHKVDETSVVAVVAAAAAAAAVVVEEEEEEVVATVEEVAGKKAILRRWTGPFPQQGMNVLNLSCLVQAILVSILTNMRTFPWRRRETTYQITLSV